MKVLIVDDEPSIVNLIRMNLKLEGYDSVCAYSGREAVEAYRQKPGHGNIGRSHAAQEKSTLTGHIDLVAGVHNAYADTGKQKRRHHFYHISNSPHGLEGTEKEISHGGRRSLTHKADQEKGDHQSDSYCHQHADDLKPLFYFLTLHGIHPQFLPRSAALSPACILQA